jgi:acetyl esterase/lipase
MLMRSLAILPAALCSACVSHQGKPAAAAPNVPLVDISVQQDVVYTPAGWPQALAADIYTPVGAGPFPAVVTIHGGGWTGRTRADMDSIAERVAKRGYVVMNVSYRLAPGYHFPAQLQDMQQAVKWLRSNAAARHVNADRIGVWGYSAGAHLAALLAVTGPGSKYFMEGSQVQAVVSGGTPVDLRFYPDGPLPNALMGVPFKQDPELWRQASPIALVSANTPPFFLYHGNLDLTVGIRNSYGMYDALTAAKVPTEFYKVRGLEHFSMFYLPPIDRGVDFLNRHLR